MADQKSSLVPISGLWLNEGKDGKKYMSGYMGNARIVILRNNFKTEEKHPDYNFYVDHRAISQDVEPLEVSEDPI